MHTVTMTAPSADVDLTALPVDTDHVKHDTELHSDLDLELAAVVHDADDRHDDNYEHKKSELVLMRRATASV